MSLAMLGALVGLALLVPILFAVVLHLCSIWPSVSRMRPPFIPSNAKLAALVAEHITPAPGETMYELGAGDMRISLACFKREPRAHYVGIEMNAWPRLLAHIKIRLARATGKVEVRYGDLFAADLSHATRVYCYLLPKPMQRLLPKFEQELPKGALVASLDFPIEAKEPEKVVDLEGYRLRLGKKLYLYRF